MGEPEQKEKPLARRDHCSPNCRAGFEQRPVQATCHGIRPRGLPLPAPPAAPRSGQPVRQGPEGPDRGAEWRRQAPAGEWGRGPRRRPSRRPTGATAAADCFPAVQFVPHMLLPWPPHIVAQLHCVSSSTPQHATNRPGPAARLRRHPRASCCLTSAERWSQEEACFQFHIASGKQNSEKCKQPITERRAITRRKRMDRQ